MRPSRFRPPTTRSEEVRTSVRMVCTSLLVALAQTLLPGCADDDPTHLVASAHTYLAQGDVQAAIIQVRNALQQSPEDGSMRLLLGRVLLQGGDPVSAEKELRKALQYHRHADEVLPLLARAMLERGHARQLVAEFGLRSLTTPQADASLKASFGHAQLYLGDTEQAAASFAAAAAADADSVPAQIGIARVALAQGQPDDAEHIADRLLAVFPESADTLVLVSELRLLRSDETGSIAALEQAVRIDDANVSARFALIGALINQQKFDAAAAHLDATRNRTKGDLRINYFDAVVALGRSDLPRARGLAQQILKHSPQHVPTLVLAGTVELRSRQPSAAEDFLRRAILLAPQQFGARRMLVRTFLEFNQPAKALDALQPLLADGVPVDALLAGETYFANGDLRRASSYFLEARESTAAESLSQKAVAQTRLGQIALASGNLGSGIRELEAVTAMHGAPMQADLSLIAGYIRSDQLDRALGAGQRLVQKHPARPLAYQVLGSTYLAMEDPTAARAQFQKALDFAPGYLPAIAALGRLDVAAGKPQDARRRFESVISGDPSNDQALLGLADVMLRTAAPSSDIATTLQRAVVVNPRSSRARLALIAHHLRNGESSLALTSAQEAVAVVPDDVRVLYVLGRAQEAAGQPNQAIDTLNRLAALEPQSTLPLTQLAAVHARRADYDKVVDTLQRARKIAATDPALVRDLIAGYLLSGSPEEAIREARSLQSAAPAFVAGYLLEGEVQSSIQQWAEAERAYRAGLKVEPDAAVLAVKLHATLVTRKKEAEADAFARRWLFDHPKDTRLRTSLAERALRARNVRSAVTFYREVVELEPGNFVALNNLAWASGQIGDARAVRYALRAAEIAPTNADVLDTLGSLLITNGNSDQGIKYLGKASSLAPKRSEIRLNYAKALVKVGNRDLAKVELEALYAEGDAAGKAEAAAVLKSL